MAGSNAGTISWVDLTVPNAEEIKSFYSKVVGWQSSPVNMGTYDDYAMLVPGTENAAAGICHLKGINKNVPSQWLIYINVDNLDVSLDECRNLGGHVLVEPKNLGEEGRYAVIQDPAGAVCALYQNL